MGKVSLGYAESQDHGLFAIGAPVAGWMTSYMADLKSLTPNPNNPSPAGLFGRKTLFSKHR